jgi:hypothetical protein
MKHTKQTKYYNMHLLFTDSRTSGNPNNASYVRMVRVEFVPWNQDINKNKHQHIIQSTRYTTHIQVSTATRMKINISTSSSPQDTPHIYKYLQPPDCAYKQQTWGKSNGV